MVETDPFTIRKILKVFSFSIDDDIAEESRLTENFAIQVYLILNYKQRQEVRLLSSEVEE